LHFVLKDLYIETGHQQLLNTENNFLKQQGKDTKWLDAQKEAWSKGLSIDPVVANYFNTTEPIQRDLVAKQAMVTSIDKEATDKFGDINSLIPKDAPNIVVTNLKGNKITFTPKDFVEFNSIKNRYVRYIKDDLGHQVFAGYDSEQAKKELGSKTMLLFNAFVNKSKTGQDQNSAEKIINDNINHYQAFVNKPYNETIAAKNKYTAEEVTKRITNNQGVDYGVPTANAAQKTSINTVLTQLTDLADSQKGALANSPNFDSEIARKIAVRGDATVSLNVVEGTSYQEPSYTLKVTGKDGTVQANITPEQKRSIFGNAYEPTPAVQAFRPYEEQIRRGNGYSTSPDGKSPYPSTSFFLSLFSSFLRFNSSCLNDEFTENCLSSC